MNLANEVGDHLLGDVEVANDAVSKRPYGGDACGSSAEHSLGLGADGQDPLGPRVDGHDAGLADDDATVANSHQGIGCTEIDPDIS